MKLLKNNIVFNDRCLDMTVYTVDLQTNTLEQDISCVLK